MVSSLESHAHQILMFQAESPFFFSFLWASTCKDVGKSTFHLSPTDRVQLQNPVWMRKLIASETSSNHRWIPAIVVLPHRHDLGGNSRKLESTLLHKSGLVVLRQHVINFQQWHFGGKDSKHQGLSSSYESILLGLAGKRGQGSHSFEDSQMQSIGQCMLALWNFKIIYPHLDMKLFFLPTVSTGFQAGELGEIYFVRNGAKRGEEEKSHVEQLHNQLVLQIKQTISSWCKNVGQNLSQLKQY